MTSDFTPPTTYCAYEFHTTEPPQPREKVFIRFSGHVAKTVTRALLDIGFWYGHKGGHWSTDAMLWPKGLEILTAAGIEAREEKVRRETRKERKAREAEAVAVAIAEAPSLASFDWSGFPAWAEANLTIKDKGLPGDETRPVGKFVPFRMNGPQKKLFAAMKAQWKRIGRIRFNVLKNRQVGLSTFIQGFIYYLALKVPGVEALVTAHRDDASDAIFHRTKLFETRCPEKLPTKYSKRKEIEWDTPHHSALRVMIAGGDEDAGRSEARQAYHASEAALYNERGLDTYANIMASIPEAAGTFVWRESTAKGQNWYYEAWDKPELEGFDNFFTGYLDDETCRLYGVALNDPCWNGMARQWFEDEARVRTMAEAQGIGEAEIVAAIAWRRRMIPSKCKSSTKIFNRENPLVADDAFTATGGHVFDIEVVDAERKRCRDTESANPAPRFSVAITDEATGAHRIALNDMGPLRIWKHPAPGVPYIVSGDFGRGRNVSGDTGDPDKLDFTTLGVWNEWTREECAVWHGRVDPDLAADVMVALGREYNNALLIPETNHYGMILVAKIVKFRKYTRIYRREKIDKATRDPQQQDPEAHYMEYGFWTTGAAKDNMIELLHEAVRDRSVTIHEPEFWDEARTYVRDEDGSTNAEKGKHDDRIIRTAIAAVYLKMHPKYQKAPVEERPSLEWRDGTLHMDGGAILQRIKEKREARDRARRGGEDFR